MSEAAILNRIRKRAGKRRASELALGIGDDCAIYRPRGAADLVFTTDLLLEDIHFRRDTHTPADIGWKALARGLSDIAAMGAEPRFFLLSLAAPADADSRWIDRFYSGVFALASRFDVELAGGDLARAPRIACDIVVCGALPQGGAMLRSGARPGDAIYVSGTLGGSALGLATNKGMARKRHLRPAPRLALGRFVREKLRATAAMDLSDGLSLDLHRLALSSKLEAAIEAPLPVFSGASLDQALHGGEDYELLFTVAEGTPVPASFDKIPVTQLGHMRKGRAGRVSFLGLPLPRGGWDHFNPAPNSKKPI